MNVFMPYQFSVWPAKSYYHWGFARQTPRSPVKLFFDSKRKYFQPHPARLKRIWSRQLNKLQLRAGIVTPEALAVAPGWTTQDTLASLVSLVVSAEGDQCLGILVSSWKPRGRNEGLISRNNGALGCGAAQPGELPQSFSASLVKVGRGAVAIEARNPDEYSHSVSGALL